MQIGKKENIDVSKSREILLSYMNGLNDNRKKTIASDKDIVLRKKVVNKKHNLVRREVRRKVFQAALARNIKISRRIFMRLLDFF